MDDGRNHKGGDGEGCIQYDDEEDIAKDYSYHRETLDIALCCIEQQHSILIYRKDQCHRKIVFLQRNSDYPLCLIN